MNSNNLPIAPGASGGMEPAQIQSVASSLITIDPKVTAVDIRHDPEKYPRIHSIDGNISYQAVTMIMMQAFTIRGQKPTATDLAASANMLLDMLLMDEDNLGLNYLTLPEIARCARRSALENDGPVSVASVYKSLKDYAMKEGNQARVAATAESERVKNASFLDFKPLYAKENGWTEREAAEHAARVRYLVSIMTGDSHKV